MIIVLILKIYFLLSFTIVKYTPSCLKHLIFVLQIQNLYLYLRTSRVWWPAVIRNKPFPGSDPGDGEWSSLTMYVRTLRRMSWTPWTKTDEWVARWRRNYHFIPISMYLYQVDPCPWRSHEQPPACRLNIKNSTTTRSKWVCSGTLWTRHHLGHWAKGTERWLPVLNLGIT